MHRVAHVSVLPDYRLELVFDDSRTGVVSVAHLAGSGVFASWTDYAVFRQVRIGESGELVWNDQIDLCPDALYLKATHQRAEEVFPALKPEPARA